MLILLIKFLIWIAISLLRLIRVRVSVKGVPEVEFLGEGEIDMKTIRT